MIPHVNANSVLLCPGGRSTYNPGLQLVNTIMAYCDDVPPRYCYIRGVVCAIFKALDLLLLDKPSEHSLILAHRIIYTSPLVTKLSDARFILCGEIHDHPSPQIKAAVFGANAKAIAITTHATQNALFVETHECPITSGPMTGAAHLAQLAKYQIPASAAFSVYGWDSPHNRGVQMQRQFADGQLDLFEMLAEAKRISQDLGVDFPLRTRSMVSSLKKMIALQKCKAFQGHVHLVAGLLHFINMESEKDQRYCLDELYQCLREIPVIVIVPEITVVFHSVCKKTVEWAFGTKFKT